MGTAIAIIGTILLFGVMIYVVNKDRWFKKKVPQKVFTPKKGVLKTTLERDLAALILRYRGDTEIKNDDLINRVCAGHANYMAKSGNHGHDNFPARSAKLIDKGIKEVSEIVSYGYGTAGGFLTGILNSPPHKKILEKKGYTHYGLSIMKGSNDRNYGIIIFAKV